MTKYPWPEKATIGDLYHPAMKITDPAAGAEYLALLIAYTIEDRAARGDPVSEDEARRIQLSNIGYFAGYYGWDTMAQVKRVFGATHPILGDTPLTAEECFAKGQQFAQGR